MAGGDLAAFSPRVKTGLAATNGRAGFAGECVLLRRLPGGYSYATVGCGWCLEAPTVGIVACGDDFCGGIGELLDCGRDLS